MCASFIVKLLFYAKKQLLYVSLQDFKSTTILLGYSALADADNQFYICVTETAQNAVVEILQQMQEDQQKWLQNALEKPSKAWVSLGSEHEVDLFTVKQSRPLVSLSIVGFKIFYYCICVFLELKENFIRCKCKLKQRLETFGHHATSVKEM